MPDITMKQTQTVVAAALKKAEEIGTQMYIAELFCTCESQGLHPHGRGLAGERGCRHKKSENLAFFRYAHR